MVTALHVMMGAVAAAIRRLWMIQTGRGGVAVSDGRPTVWDAASAATFPPILSTFVAAKVGESIVRRAI